MPMNTQPNIHSTPGKTRHNPLWWLAGILVFALLCGGLIAPGNALPVKAQGQSPTITPPTPYQCMYVAYSFATETAIVVGVRNNSGATTRLSSATLDWPSALGGAGGDYVDYFTFYTGTFYPGNGTSSPTTDNTIPTGTAYDIANNVTREFVAGFGALPLPRPLAGSFTVTLQFSNGCLVTATIDVPEPPTPTVQATNTPVTGQCNIAYAYVTELAVVVGIRNNTAANVRLSTTTLYWPAGLGGTGGDYVDYFQLGGNQFYNGNDTAPTTAATPANNATYQITPGQTRNFVAVFGLAPLPRPLYGTFTATFTFRSGCSPIMVSVSRTPPPSTCPTITNAYISGAGDLYFVVYNGMAVNTNFTGASLDWPDIPSPNRTVNYFAWGADSFYPGNDASPPTAATDPSPDLFTAGQTTFFRVNFSNPGVMAGTFTATLNFSLPCTATHSVSWGVPVTPTRTRTSTPTPTRIPLMGTSTVRYAAMLLNAPDYLLPSQMLGGTVMGGGGPEYTLAIYVKAPSQTDATASVYGLTLDAPGPFTFAPPGADAMDFGCSEEGIWETWFMVTDPDGEFVFSNRTSWAVNFPRSHGIP